jgi:uncharacterized protein YaaW (UPF0174 family)
MCYRMMRRGCLTINAICQTLRLTTFSVEENIRTYIKLPYKNKMHTIHLHYYNIFTDESVTFRGVSL